MRYLSTFSGIEAATVAWGPLGWEPLAFAEVDSFPSAVLAERFPGVENVGDVRLADWSRFRGSCDLVVGGSPCQSFSVAGKREGLDGASGLMWEYVRCVRDVRPGAFLWENVPGALSSSKGADFRCLLAAMDELGYGMAWRVLDAQFFGVAQRRRRVFLVGCLGDPGRACEVLFEPEGVPWDPGQGKEKREALAAGAGGGAGASGCHGFNGGVSSGAGSIGYADELAPTVRAQANGLVPQVAYTAQVRCGREGGGKGALVAEELSATLATGNGQALFQRATFVGGDSSCTVIDGASGTITASTGRKTADCVGYALPPADALAFAANQRGEARLQGGDGHAFGALPTAWSGKQAQGVVQGYAVRKLMPVECERLQGFPDDWTRIPWRGKPPEECPDAPRYKAVGNSMAVPVMRWIGERMDGVTGDA